MSTRSGKRLHNSPNENIEPENVSKKDRKTRYKRVVENDDEQAVSLKLKKRQNYVSFPADEETSVVDYVADEIQTKPARVLRRNTLKEQNAISEEIESANSVKKQVRSTRRTKKFSETAADNAPESTPNEEPVEIVTVANGKPKSKKNKKKSKETDKPELTDKQNEVKVGKKKKNKKKKNSKSNSLPEEKKKNESNVSTDSFHSAAGSPVLEAVTSPLIKSSPKHAETENKKRRSSLKRISGLNTITQVSMEVDENVDTNIEKEAEIIGVRQSKRRRSSLKIVPNQHSKSVDTNEKVDLNATFEKESTDEGSNKKKRKCNLMVENTDIPLTTASSNVDIPKTSHAIFNTTFEKDDTVNGTKMHKNKKSEDKDLAKDISQNSSKSLNTSFEIRKSPRKSINTSDKCTALNGTFDMSPKPDQTKQKLLDSTFDKETKLDSTFDKTSKKASLGSKSSLVTSDDATNSSIVTLDKSDSSKISITDDDSKTENILNTTPLLIESSMEESKVLESSTKENKTPEFQPKPATPLKREGTFTKDGPDTSMSPKTPTKRQTLPAAGCTPYHSNGKGSQKKRSIMNLTHSIEKPGPAEAAPRATRVMFCSPVNHPGVATQRKTMIIKSNLKGSNKSFVFDESMSSLTPERSGRKRSYTHTEGERAGAGAGAGGGAGPKRSRLAEPARARTVSATAKPTDTPAKCGTPSAPRSEVKATRLPNFAALHARRFERMESLDECQQRRAQRARLLLVPTGSVAVRERGSPRGLHNSPNENIEPENVSKKDRKTRYKRVVENDDEQAVSLKLKKRQNYVSFPADEETSVVDYVADEIQTKPARVLRRNTLKEQNAISEEIESANSVKKQVRSTRRTKKFSETAADNAPESTPNEEPVEIVTVANGKPKSKKNKKKSKETDKPELTDKQNEVKVGKKKKNKKKKNSKSNSLPEEKKKNESNVSTDSFHSAAGSPVLEAVTSPLIKSSPKHAETENKKRRSSLKRISGLNTITQVSMEVDENVDTNIEKEAEIIGVRQSKRRRSSLKIVPNQHSKSVDTNEKVDLNATFEKESTDEGSNKKKRKCNLMVENTDIPLTTASSNVDIPKTSHAIFNTTFEKDDTVNGTKMHKNKKSEDKDLAKDISQNSSKSLNTSFEIRKSPRKSINTSDKCTALNGTFDMSPKPDQTKQKLLDSTFDKETKLDSTFDKTSKKASLGSKSSLVTSDDATNSSIVTLDKSDSSKISITDDDSKTENILNTTPLLIESSMEESKVLESSTKENKTPEFQPKPATPLKREGTFTKDGPDTSMSPKTPTKRQTLPAAGCTPYHSNGKGSQKKRSIMNLTHSIEKPGPAEAAPRATRVMFCSPVNHPGVATQRKTMIIKSNLKGSNKSFVFDESMSSLTPERSGRKRSYTHTEGERAGAGAGAGGGAGPKRSRLAEPARARTVSATAKPTDTPAKCGTPSAPRSEVKATRLPNFAALHARRFERMESLDECQQRRAQRARLLLVPTGSVAVRERGSPRATPTANKLEPKPRDTPPKTATPAKLPALGALQRGYTRFGFKMNCDVNPFSVPPKTAGRPKDTRPEGNKPAGLAKPKGDRPDGAIGPLASSKRQVTQPSLAGATSLRRALARHAIMREKSFTLAEKTNETRKEVRTVIKGVRTNRRFELQMKSRNING